MQPNAVGKPVVDPASLKARSTCACCSLTDDANSPPILVCTVCTFSVHEKCYGSTSASTPPSATSGWKCDLCTAKAQDRLQAVRLSPSRLTAPLQRVLITCPQTIKRDAKSIHRHVSCPSLTESSLHLLSKHRPSSRSER
jgi:hypothetical protein